MKPAPFRYERATTIEEAIERLPELGDEAKVLAGGQSLVPMMNLRLAQPKALLDVNPVTGLSFIERTEDDSLVVGATVTQAELDTHSVSDVCPLLGMAIPHIAHAAIRNRGTVGGSIAHADPAAELPVVVCALGGTMTVRSTRGERQIPARGFFTGFLSTACEPDEILTSVALPARQAHHGYAFEEFARRTSDFALVSVGSVVSVADDGEVASVVAAVGGVADTPLVAELGGDSLASPDVESAADQLAEHVTLTVSPSPDMHATTEYRKHLTRRLIRRAVRNAYSDAWRHKA